MGKQAQRSYATFSQLCRKSVAEPAIRDLASCDWEGIGFRIAYKTLMGVVRLLVLIS